MSHFYFDALKDFTMNKNTQAHALLADPVYREAQKVVFQKMLQKVYEDFIEASFGNLNGVISPEETARISTKVLTTTVASLRYICGLFDIQRPQEFWDTAMAEAQAGTVLKKDKEISDLCIANKEIFIEHLKAGLKS